MPQPLSLQQEPHRYRDSIARCITVHPSCAPLACPFGKTDITVLLQENSHRTALHASCTHWIWTLFHTPFNYLKCHCIMVIEDLAQRLLNRVKTSGVSYHTGAFQPDRKTPDTGIRLTPAVSTGQDRMFRHGRERRKRYGKRERPRHGGFQGHGPGKKNGRWKWNGFPWRNGCRRRNGRGHGTRTGEGRFWREPLHLPGTGREQSPCREDRS